MTDLTTDDYLLAITNEAPESHRKRIVKEERKSEASNQLNIYWHFDDGAVVSLNYKKMPSGQPTYNWVDLRIFLERVPDRNVYNYGKDQLLFKKDICSNDDYPKWQIVKP